MRSQLSLFMKFIDSPISFSPGQVLPQSPFLPPWFHLASQAEKVFCLQDWRALAASFESCLDPQQSSGNVDKIANNLFQCLQYRIWNSAWPITTVAKCQIWNIYVQGAFFNCSHPKISKRQPVSKLRPKKLEYQNCSHPKKTKKEKS